MNYDLSFMENSTNFFQVTQGVNNASDGYLGLLFLLLVWIGLFIVLKKTEDSINDFVVSSFLTSIIAVLMLVLELISWQFVLIPIMAFLISFIISMVQK